MGLQGTLRPKTARSDEPKVNQVQMKSTAQMAKKNEEE
jgi:hypothetical protein